MKQSSKLTMKNLILALTLSTSQLVFAGAADPICYKHTHQGRSGVKCLVHSIEYQFMPDQCSPNEKHPKFGFCKPIHLSYVPGFTKADVESRRIRELRGSTLADKNGSYLSKTNCEVPTRPIESESPWISYQCDTQPQATEGTPGKYQRYSIQFDRNPYFKPSTQESNIEFNRAILASGSREYTTSLDAEILLCEDARTVAKNPPQVLKADYSMVAVYSRNGARWICNIERRSADQIVMNSARLSQSRSSRAQEQATRSAQ